MADDTRVQIAVDRKRQRTRDGRCRHNEQIGTGALRAQGIALADAKPVLLIDDYERQILKRHVIRKDRVGSKEDVELSRFQLCMDALALCGRRGTRQKRPRHAGLREQRAGLIGILTRQHARGRHNAGLCAAIGSHSQRAGGNGGLTGTDIAQQQAVHHAPAIAHIAQDILERGLLLVAQRKRQGLLKRGQVLARGVGVGHHIDQAAVVAQAQRQLQVEALLVGKPCARDIALSHARRKVDRSKRTSIAHQATFNAQACGNRVEGIADDLERATYDAAHPCLAHAVTHIMDRQNGARSTPVIKLFKVRRGHLLKTVGKLDLAHHGQAVALLKLLGNPRLTEKGDLQHARLVNE